MTDEDFKRTLESGEWAEEIVAEYIKANGFQIKHFWKDKEYDILAEKDGKEIKIEVKLDQSPLEHTINIEYYSNGTASGISVTEADYYFCLQPKTDELMRMKVDDIKETILMKGDEIVKTNKGSHGRLAIMYNMYKDEIKNQRIKIDWRKYETKKYVRPDKLKKL